MWRPPPWVGTTWTKSSSLPSPWRGKSGHQYSNCHFSPFSKIFMSHEADQVGSGNKARLGSPFYWTRSQGSCNGKQGKYIYIYLCKSGSLTLLSISWPFVTYLIMNNGQYCAWSCNPPNHLSHWLRNNGQADKWCILSLYQLMASDSRTHVALMMS